MFSLGDGREQFLVLAMWPTAPGTAAAACMAGAGAASIEAPHSSQKRAPSETWPPHLGQFIETLLS